MTLAIITIVISLGLLVWSADKFVDGAANLAEGLGMPKIMVGLTIVALGTSAPEIFVSISAALEQAPELALGNAIGSNIANIGLVLGVTALISPLPIKSGLVKEDLPAMVAVSAIVFLLLWDLTLSMADGLAMLVLLSILMTLLYIYKREHADELIDPATLDAQAPTISTYKASADFIIGLVILIASAKALVWGAVTIATAMQVSEVVIGLTIVAIGTSLPELAASITSALRNQHDIALGNIVGSNILNLLAVLPGAALIQPIQLNQQALFNDYGSMLGLTFGLVILVLLAGKRKQLSKIAGSLLLIGYIVYLYSLYLRNMV